MIQMEDLHLLGGICKTRKTDKILDDIKLLHTFAPHFKRKNATKAESLAQQVEHIPFKDGVLGSSPRRITPKKVFISEDLFFFKPVITNDIQPVISCL